MNILIDKLPESVFVGGKEYLVNWDFRTLILCEMLLFDDEIKQEDKIIGILELFYKGFNDKSKIVEAYKEVINFWKCYKTDKPSTGEGSGEKLYCYNEDDLLIWSAFKQCYNVDLQDVENLHWFKFKAMFNDLEHSCEFMQAIIYRNTDANKIKEPKERQRIIKIKARYSLEKAEEIEFDDMVKALRGESIG